MERALPRWTRSDTVDAAIAAGAVALSVTVLAGPADRDALEPLAWILALAHSLPLLARRRYPRVAFAISAVAALAYLALGHEMVGLGVGGLVMMYSLGAEASRRDSLIGLAAVETLMPVAVGLSGTGMSVDTQIGNGLVLAAAWLIGDSARRRKEQAQREQRTLARQAVTEDRLRIARELHDMVAHSMSVVSVQAGMARTVMDDEPDRARGSLLAIEDASHEALDEMRRLLVCLREDDRDLALLSPTPRLDDLDGLVAHAAAGGTPVEVLIEGKKRRLGPGVELTAYRVVQEALTNARKHAPGAPTRLHLEYRDDQLSITVDNELRNVSRPTGAGHGLAGMRERIALYRGHLETGPLSNGSYRVAARIPYDPTVP